MRMEVGREASAAAAAAEDPVASDAPQNAAERMRALKEERQRWIAKRQQAMARQEKLLKLLELQRAKESKGDQNAGDTANNETKTSTATAQVNEIKEVKDAAATAALARKKELKELQARALAAQEKQQQAANVLARNLKQLLARNAHRSQATKRKREEEATDNQPSKKVDVGAEGDEAVPPAPAMHPFAGGSDLNTETPELAAAACFRIALRHLVQTGTVMSRERLEQVFNTYTGKRLGEVMDNSLFESSLAFANAGGSKQAAVPLSRSTRGEPVCWQPGRQSLQIPTFSSSQADRIQALIEVEKQVVADACNSIWMEKSSTLAINNRRQKQFLASLLGVCVATPPNTVTLSTILSACVGVNLPKSSTTGYSKRFPYLSYGQIASVFDKMEGWLRDQAKRSEPSNSLSSRLDEVNHPRSFSSRYAKPFCVASESVVMQLRDVGSPHSAVTKRLDPMKILCHYELNGVCNDRNCSNYHLKDYHSVLDSINYTGDSIDADSDARLLQTEGMDQLLASFAEFRGRIMSKWPVISSSQPSSVLAEKNTGATAIDASLPASEPDPSTSQDIQQSDDDAEEGNDDFIVLANRVELPVVGDARYFDDIESRNLYGDSLQEKVEEDPNDTDAWLLLAIYHLELDVELSDEAANLSDDARLRQQLVFLSKELNAVYRSGTPRKLNIEEPNLKRCLHTLSRALEVEANAYCEALWLLYLHLCGQVTTKQTEIDTVEQAVQFLPSSHALWLRYVSTYDFDSVGMAEGIYWRLLEHLARVNSSKDGQAADPRPKKELSILLTAICFHLCIKLWRAGATKRVIELLSALLQIGDTSSEFGWCKMVRGQLRGDETVVICLVFAHALLFNEMPNIIEYWVAASSYETVPIKAMAYTIEYLESRRSIVDKEVFKRVLVACELAFQTYQNRCHGVEEAGGVVLSNWMLLLSLQDEGEERDESLKTFFDNKLDMIQRFPVASHTAAKILMLKPSGEQQAHQIMLSMMRQDSQALFPDALHHYLFACRQSSALVNALDKAFPDVMQRLAGLLSVDSNKVEKFIQDIMRGTSNISKARALNALLDALLDAWMGQLAALHRDMSQKRVLDERDSLRADIYVVLDICLLMGILLEPSAAVNGLQMVLSSSHFGALSLEARQLAWMQRFVFEVDLLQQEDVDSSPWREHQAGLTKLFRKYVGEMGVEAEVLRQVSKQIKDDMERNAVEDAVCDCLYPERHQLITFDANIEIFRLCLAAVAGPEQTTFYASFTDSLALSSEFSLAFSDAADHEWELLAARASLRKCLGRAKTQHPQVLQALVAVELRLRNMKAVSSLLESEIRAEPLLLETWRLAVGLEILFGERLDERSQKIAAEMEKRQLVFACNTYGDDKLASEGALSVLRDSEAALTLRGLRLPFVPNSVLLKNELVSLNLSGNELAELPAELGRLKSLQKLDASENGLIEFPACISNLTQLEDLRLAHNNIQVVPNYSLPHLNAVDIRWNAVSQLSASSLDVLQNLMVLHAGGNAVPDEQLVEISELLLSRKRDAASLENETSKRNTIVRTEEPSVEEDTALSSANANAEVAKQTVDSELVAGVNTELEAKEDADDQARNLESVSVEAEAGQVAEAVDHASPPVENNEDQEISAAGEIATISESKDGDGDHIMDNAASVILIGDAGTEMVDAAAEPPKEVIDVDSPESTEEAESNNNITELTVASDAPVASTMAEPSSATESFERSHTDAASAVAPQRMARKKLVAYMKENHIDDRTEVRRRNPVLWREFVAANLQVQSVLPACRLCFTPNDGHNQRFNSTVLCMRCLEDAIHVLKERDDPMDVAQDGV